jgi:hypothetical protein
MATLSSTAAEFLGPPLADRLSAKAKGLKLSQLAELRKNVLQHQPAKGALATLSFADLHSIREAFAPYADGDVGKMNIVGSTCCCCCCPCCCCATACSSSCA